MAKNLTKKQKGFSDDWLELGNGTKAALKNYDTTDENTAANIASVNLRKTKIIAYLEEAAAGATIRIKELSEKAKNEAVKLNANKDILDRAGYKPVEKTQHSGEIKYTITGMKISKDGN